MSRAKNPKYESMSLVERRERSHRLIVKTDKRLPKQLKKQRREMTANGAVSFFSKTCIQRKRADCGRFRAEDLLLTLTLSAYL